MKKRFYFFLASLLFMVAGMQTAWAQGFRVYQSDGTELQFSLKTDSIVFDNGLSGDQVFGPFTPVNFCIAKKWFKSKTETVTFNANGTTDYVSGGTYEFLPYQGNIIIYNSAKMPVAILRVYKVEAEKMIVGMLGASTFSTWATTPLPQYVQEIVLSETSLTLRTDDIKTIKATVLPEDADNKKVTWESSDEDVAEVNKNGRVIANLEGTCTITCRATDGSGVYAECQVTVTEEEPTLVTNIVLNYTSLNLKVDDTQQLTATVEPSDATNKAVTWQSSNTSVATVSTSGLVTAKAEGSCVVTCRAKDGSGVYEECLVTVGGDDTQLVTSIVLNYTSLNLKVNKTQQLTATVEPWDADNKTVAWQSSNTSVATVSTSGLVTAKAAGTCTVTCRATDGSGVKAECTVKVVAGGSGNLDGHDYVDLDLPSGTLWATCNVGADDPVEYGDHFAWGETETKTNYGWNTYKYCGGSYTNLTKYCMDSGHGDIDELAELLPEDDAATVNWGENWQTPSYSQLMELFNSSYTTSEWTTQNDVNGYMITSKSNGKHIFLPAAGMCNGTNLGEEGSGGRYWAREVNEWDSNNALSIYFNRTRIETDAVENSTWRCFGFSVRPVVKQ